MRVVLCLFLLLVSSPVLADEPTVAFEPREGALVGWTWTQSESWVSKGHSVVKLGPVKIRNRKLDKHVTFSCGVEVQEVVQVLPSQVALRCWEANAVDHGEAEELPVTGLDVQGLGVGSERKFETADGDRLKKSLREFFERRFRDRDPDVKEPLGFLLPEGPVTAGDSWTMDLQAIQDWFGPDRFTMDRTQSHGRVALREVVERDGDLYGRLDFSTAIVPATIRDGEFQEARMLLEGSALLPLRGDLPYMELDLDMDIRFLGKVKRKGIGVHLDIDTRVRGWEKKQPAT